MGCGHPIAGELSYIAELESFPDVKLPVLQIRSGSAEAALDDRPRLFVINRIRIQPINWDFGGPISYLLFRLCTNEKLGQSSPSD